MKLLAAVSLLLAVGCTPVPRPVVGQEYLDQRARAAANSKQCMDAVKSGNSVYARLNDLFIYDLNDNRQLTKMTNRNFVTEQNIADLIGFREMIQPCYDLSLADYGRADSRYAEYMLRVRANSDDNLLALLNRRISIGERNVYLLETLLGNRNKFAEIDREVIADINRAHSLRVENIQNEAVVVEEGYAYPAVSLPKQPWPLLPEPGRSVPEPAKPQTGEARCRFVGPSIRCD